MDGLCKVKAVFEIASFRVAGRGSLQFHFRDSLESAGMIPWSHERSAHEAGALRTRDLKRVTVDTTVQPKAMSMKKRGAKGLGAAQALSFADQARANIHA
jgi:hypothetical protein